MKSKLEKFRTRWLRWLGQRTRSDEDTWVELLDCNWIGWVSRVIDKHSLDISCLSWQSSLWEVKGYYQLAILHADMKDLQKLDHLCVTDLIERPRKKTKRKTRG